MERRTGPAGRSSVSNNASRPNTPYGTDATNLTKTKTAATYPQNDSQDIHGHEHILSPEIPPRAWTAPNMRDGVELENMSPASMTSSPGSISSGSLRMVTRQETRISMRSTSSREPTGTFAPVVKFWRRHVVLSVEQKQCRDHFALERTYLAYFRTALAFAMLGVFVAQLFSLQHMMNNSKGHDPVFGFYKVGLPLACACYGVSIVVSLLGAYRFWRQQNAMANSKVHAGGWEVNAVAILTTLTILVLFVLVVIITARKG